MTLKVRSRDEDFSSSSIGGLRTPAPVRAAQPSWGRHPQTFTGADISVQMTVW
jgi:hypothetical protein